MPGNGSADPNGDGRQPRPLRRLLPVRVRGVDHRPHLPASQDGGAQSGQYAAADVVDVDGHAVRPQARRGVELRASGQNLVPLVPGRRGDTESRSGAVHEDILAAEGDGGRQVGRHGRSSRPPCEGEMTVTVTVT